MNRQIILCILLGFILSDKSLAQDELFICRYLFASSNEITELAKDAISLAVDAVWAASEITGTATITGTLTQNQINLDVWTYASNPQDKLVLIFANGQTVFFTFLAIDGYTGGTEEDFKQSHAMDFITVVPDRVDIRIHSNTYPAGGKIYWERTITGTIPYYSQTMAVDISHTGNLDYYIEPPHAYHKYEENVSGSSNTISSTVNIDEKYIRTMTHNSDSRIFVMNTEIQNNSSGNFGGITYQYQNAYVFWAAVTTFADSAYAGYYNNVIDAHEWEASGYMLKNGQVYGNVRFDGPVVNGTSGPDLVLHLNNGTDIALHPVIGSFTTGINDEISFINDFLLMQNYPNPFNTSTTISYTIPSELSGGYITLKVFDVLGKEVAILVNETQTAGTYIYNFDSLDLASGIYFYSVRIKPENNRGESYYLIKKMLLLK